MEGSTSVAILQAPLPHIAATLDMSLLGAEPESVCLMEDGSEWPLFANVSCIFMYHKLPYECVLRLMATVLFSIISLHCVC